MITQATSEAIGRGAATKILDGSIDIVGPEDKHTDSSCTGAGHDEGGGSCGSGAGAGKLTW